MEAQQALAILQALQSLPKGARLDITHSLTGEWLVECKTSSNGIAIDARAEHWGSDLTDALAQLTQTIIK